MGFGGRTPSLPEAELEHIVSLADGRGYETQNLIYVEQ